MKKKSILSMSGLLLLVTVMSHGLTERLVADAACQNPISFVHEYGDRCGVYWKLDEILNASFNCLSIHLVPNASLGSVGGMPVLSALQFDISVTHWDVKAELIAIGNPQNVVLFSDSVAGIIPNRQERYWWLRGSLLLPFEYDEFQLDIWQLSQVQESFNASVKILTFPSSEECKSVVDLRQTFQLEYWPPYMGISDPLPEGVGRVQVSAVSEGIFDIEMLSWSGLEVFESMKNRSNVTFECCESGRAGDAILFVTNMRPDVNIPVDVDIAMFDVSGRPHNGTYQTMSDGWLEKDEPFHWPIPREFQYVVWAFNVRDALLEVREHRNDTRNVPLRHSTSELTGWHSLENLVSSKGRFAVVQVSANVSAPFQGFFAAMDLPGITYPDYQLQLAPTETRVLRLSPLLTEIRVDSLLTQLLPRHFAVDIDLELWEDSTDPQLIASHQASSLKDELLAQTSPNDQYFLVLQNPYDEPVAVSLQLINPLDSPGHYPTPIDTELVIFVVGTVVFCSLAAVNLCVACWLWGKYLRRRRKSEKQPEDERTVLSPRSQNLSLDRNVRWIGTELWRDMANRPSVSVNEPSSSRLNSEKSGLLTGVVSASAGFVRWEEKQPTVGICACLCPSPEA